MANAGVVQAKEVMDQVNYEPMLALKDKKEKEAIVQREK